MRGGQDTHLCSRNSIPHRRPVSRHRSTLSFDDLRCICMHSDRILEARIVVSNGLSIRWLRVRVPSRSLEFLSNNAFFNAARWLCAPKPVSDLRSDTGPKEMSGCRLTTSHACHAVSRTCRVRNRRSRDPVLAQSLTDFAGGLLPRSVRAAYASLMGAQQEQRLEMHRSHARNRSGS